MCLRSHLSPLEDYDQSPHGSYFGTSYGHEGDCKLPTWTFAKAKSCLNTLIVIKDKITGCKKKLTIDAFNTLESSRWLVI